MWAFRKNHTLSQSLMPQSSFTVHYVQQIRNKWHDRKYLRRLTLHIINPSRQNNSTIMLHIHTSKFQNPPHILLETNMRQGRLAHFTLPMADNDRHPNRNQARGLQMHIR
ncbi:hypothetical protein CRM22_001762 [Opisthorchis felineus]|uniref:Uncharacterized protein n=1 Tax=Opisthorchis felineus TaxID=147828 RepID=A0A4S2MFH9_OPIFE|nr:hypothetical protein CRM22_001762 [Opisthorchis felineus]